eukprot:8552512-Alexandrium_andersonii.AAC.1
MKLQAARGDNEEPASMAPGRPPTYAATRTHAAAMAGEQPQLRHDCAGQRTHSTAMPHGAHVGGRGRQSDQ